MATLVLQIDAFYRVKIGPTWKKHKTSGIMRDIDALTAAETVIRLLWRKYNPSSCRIDMVSVQENTKVLSEQNSYDGGIDNFRDSETGQGEGL